MAGAVFPGTIEHRCGSVDRGYPVLTIILKMAPVAGPDLQECSWLLVIDLIEQDLFLRPEYKIYQRIEKGELIVKSIRLFIHICSACRIAGSKAFDYFPAVSGNKGIDLLYISKCFVV